MLGAKRGRNIPRPMQVFIIGVTYIAKHEEFSAPSHSYDSEESFDLLHGKEMFNDKPKNAY